MNVDIQDRIVRGGKLLLGLLVGIVAVWILYALRGILFPLGLSFLFAYVLNPVTNRLEGTGISRTGAIGLIYLVVLLTLVLGIVFLVPVIRTELESLSTNFPEYLDKIEHTMDTWENKLKSYIPMLENYDLAGEIAKRGKTAAEMVVKQAPGMISNVVTILTFLIIVPFATFFLLKDGRSMKTALIRLVPNRYFEMTLNLLWKMDRPLGGYIRGQLIDASIIGLLAITGLSIIGLNYFMVIGAIAGITNMVPYLGPTMGFVLASVIALITDGSMGMVLKVAIVFACVQLTDNILVQPMVMSRSVRLHPLAIMVVVLIGSQLMGILGMVLAVPLTGVIKVTVETLRENLRGYAGAGT
ncbi:MAG: hypothetical protein B1H02_04690 [Candidatus Latescibacteria bacterium 4484_107]|nr:MAG: hypothetical protein B1H02_04690 [Candidatus Latescibacteria bacterium 4484_107]